MDGVTNGRERSCLCNAIERVTQFSNDGGGFTQFGGDIGLLYFVHMWLVSSQLPLLFSFERKKGCSKIHSDSLLNGSKEWFE